MVTVTETILRNAKIVINWYPNIVEGTTNWVVYRLKNVASYKRMLFRIKVEKIEKFFLYTQEEVSNIPFPSKFKIYFSNGKQYKAETPDLDAIEVGKVYEKDVTSEILPYLTDGDWKIRIGLEIRFPELWHSGYHVYVTVEMIIEDNPEIIRIGYWLSPSEMASIMLGNLILAIQPFLPLIFLFLIGFIILKIIL